MDNDWTDINGEKSFASREEAVSYIRKKLASDLKSRMENAKNFSELSDAFREFKHALHNTRIRLYVGQNNEGVYLCRRPANLDIPIPIEHHWLRTPKYEAGMGGDCPVPGQGCADYPYVETRTIDHAGQSELLNANCEFMPDVDVACVEGRIMPGQATGWWTPFNQCQSFASRVIFLCRKK